MINDVGNFKQKLSIYYLEDTLEIQQKFCISPYEKRKILISIEGTVYRCEAGLELRSVPDRPVVDTDSISGSNLLELIIVERFKFLFCKVKYKTSCKFHKYTTRQWITIDGIIWQKCRACLTISNTNFYSSFWFFYEPFLFVNRFRWLC